MKGRCLNRLTKRSQLVGVTGFEPAAPCSQSTCATKLRHTPSTEAVPHKQQSDYSMKNRALSSPRRVIYFVWRGSGLPFIHREKRTGLSQRSCLGAEGFAMTPYGSVPWRVIVGAAAGRTDVAIRASMPAMRSGERCGGTPCPAGKRGWAVKNVT